MHKDWVVIHIPNIKTVTWISLGNAEKKDKIRIKISFMAKVVSFFFYLIHNVLQIVYINVLNYIM